MSIFSTPEELIPDVKKGEKMNSDLSAILPKELAGAVNLMAQPYAGAAAFSALGIGLASHAFGMWMGAVSSAAEVSQRLFSPIYDEFAGDTESFAEKPRSPAARARSATKALITDARSAAHEIAGAAEDVVEAAVDDGETIAEKAVEAVPASVETIANLMPEDFRQPKAMDMPETPDDLKAISGIGPKLEKVLNGLGVWTFAQIAAWGSEETAWVDDYLSFKGWIGRDNWIGQAERLAKIETKH